MKPRPDSSLHFTQKNLSPQINRSVNQPLELEYKNPTHDLSPPSDDIPLRGRGLTCFLFATETVILLSGNVPLLTCYFQMKKLLFPAAIRGHIPLITLSCVLPVTSGLNKHPESQAGRRGCLCHSPRTAPSGGRAPLSSPAGSPA